MNKHYLIVDNSTQWSTYAIKTGDSRPDLSGTYVSETYDLNSLPHYSPFLNEIRSRCIHFRNESFQGPGIQYDSFYGWTISEKEFNNLARACELLDSWKEFKEILQING